MEELTEVITAAEFHPVHCNLFMYSSSKGTIKLSDMRESALCDQHAKRKDMRTFGFIHATFLDLLCAYFPAQCVNVSLLYVLISI